MKARTPAIGFLLIRTPSLLPSKDIAFSPESFITRGLPVIVSELPPISFRLSIFQGVYVQVSGQTQLLFANSVRLPKLAMMPAPNGEK